ncbi:hypothetical protein HBA54_13540 [Pelagibius litoralis]|uniref:CARDB domain-containing protein n=1 Tax=Pelagibius litoralis TaxID=374515 RepID=A0A967EY87_9PROT|nr:CARDB domain-containing protein [Pelagibius litoralis]NIA69619.1 hypothetical protein [Pelagibius litoralis]
MIKNLILASATAVTALTFSAPEFAGGSQAAAGMTAQSAQLKAGPAKQQPPTRKPTDLPGAGAADDYKPAPYVDLYGTFGFPLGLEGTPGAFFCAPLFTGDTKSEFVQIKVRNQGTKAAGPVRVVFEFPGSGRVAQTMPMNNLNGTYVYQANIPANAWKNGKVDFTMRIDHPNKVAESNENNNVYSSFCTDPNA